MENATNKPEISSDLYGRSRNEASGGEAQAGRRGAQDEECITEYLDCSRCMVFLKSIFTTVKSNYLAVQCTPAPYSFIVVVTTQVLVMKPGFTYRKRRKRLAHEIRQSRMEP